MRSIYRAIQSAAHTAFVIVIITSLIAPIVTTGANAEADANVIINPPSSVVNLGQTVMVEIYLNNVTDLWGGQVALHFDPTVLQVVDASGEPATKIQRGTLLDPAHLTEVINVVDNTSGRIEYAATLRNNPHNPVPPASGSGSFALIYFKGISVGTSPVIFSVEGMTFVHEQLFVQLIDNTLQPLVLPTEDGSVKVQVGNPIFLPIIVNSHSSLGMLVPPETTPAVVNPTGPETVLQPWPEGWLRTSPPEGWSAPSVMPLDVPEHYLSIYIPFDMTFVGNIAYYDKQSALEICNTSDPHIIASVDTTNHAEFTIYSGCSHRPGKIVADSSYVYFQDWATNTIRRIPVGGGEIITLATAGNIYKHRGLATDGAYIYFDDDIGLKRVPVGGGTIETLVTGYDQSQITVDNSYVYWTEKQGW
jgi:hypothetical protein